MKGQLILVLDIEAGDSVFRISRVRINRDTLLHALGSIINFSKVKEGILDGLKVADVDGQKTHCQLAARLTWTMHSATDTQSTPLGAEGLPYFIGTTDLSIEQAFDREPDELKVGEAFSRAITITVREPEEWRTGTPPAGIWCWIASTSGVLGIARADPGAVGGWSNEDTWEDFHHEVRAWWPVASPTGYPAATEDG